MGVWPCGMEEGVVVVPLLPPLFVPSPILGVGGADFVVGSLYGGITLIGTNEGPARQHINGNITSPQVTCKFKQSPPS